MANDLDEQNGPVNPAGHDEAKGINKRMSIKRTNKPGGAPPLPNGGINQYRIDATQGVFKTYANSLMTTASENISPSNLVRQGTYSAFGNNAITRTAMGVMDNSFDALEKFITGKGPEDEEPSTDKLLKEQIKIAQDTQIMLKNLFDTMLKVQNGENKIGEDDLHPIEDEKQANGERKKKDDKLEDKSPVYDLLNNVASDVLDIKHILTDGFDRMKETVDRDGGRRDHIDDDIEDAVIIKETTYSKKRDLVVAKHNVSIEKMLKSIAKNSDKTVALLSNGPLSTAEGYNGNQIKHMGNVEEVKPSELPGMSESKMDAENATLLALLSGAVGYFFDGLVSGIKSLAGKVVDMFKAGFDIVGSALSKAWDFLKDGAKTIVDGAKKAWDGVIDFGKGMFDKAKGLVDNVVAKVPEAIKAAPEALAKGAKALASGAGKAAKFIPGIGAIATVGMTGYDAYDAASNAESVLDIKDRKATAGEKAIAGVGGAVESLSFGLIGKEDTARWIDGLISDKKDKQAELNEKQQQLSNKEKAIAPSAAAGSPVSVSSTTNNAYYAGKKPTHNSDGSYNRYMDKHYSF